MSFFFQLNEATHLLRAITPNSPTSNNGLVVTAKEQVHEPIAEGAEVNGVLDGAGNERNELLQHVVDLLCVPTRETIN